MGLELKHLILFSVAIVGPSIGSLDEPQADFGSGNNDEHIIIFNEEDGSTYEGDDQLYIEVNKKIVDSSGPVDQDNFNKIDIPNLMKEGFIDVTDDIGSGDSQVSLEDADGSGSEDNTDFISSEMNDIIVRGVIDGYRIMRINSNKVYFSDSSDDIESNDDQISLEVNTKVATGSNLTFGGISEPLKVDSGDDLANGFLMMNGSFEEADMASEDNSVSGDDENSGSGGDRSVLLKTTTPVKEEVKATDSGDDLGFLRMITSKNEEIAVEPTDVYDYNDDKFLDYINSLEVPSFVPTDDDFLDYINSIEVPSFIPTDNLEVTVKQGARNLSPPSQRTFSTANIVSYSMGVLFFVVIVCYIIKKAI